MPRRSPVESSAEPAQPSTEEQLATIVMYLQKMNRRDRLRTWGGLFRNLIALIPILLVLWSAWYFVQHGDDFIEKLTKEAVKQSAAYSQDSLMEQIQQYLQKKQ